MEEKIKALQKAVNEKISEFLQVKKKEAKNKNASFEFLELLDNIEDFIMRGGKRLRPVLFFYGYTLAGGKKKQEAISCSIAIEFLHSYLLIHDDIIDQDEFRHYGPSMHYWYEKKYSSKYQGKDLKHFGHSMAINAGDVIFSWSYEAIASADFDPGRKIDVMKEISKINQNTVMGQVLDMSLEMGSVVKEDLIYSVQYYKTALYTITGPLQLGAILAGAGNDELKFIYDFSVPLGIAYQIQDDILGIFGDEEKIGKPVGSDLREGKKTLLISYIIDNAEKVDKEFVLSRLGRQDISREDVEKIREIMIKSGALKDSERRMEELNSRFISCLKSSSEKFSKKYLPLEDFGKFLLKRKV